MMPTSIDVVPSNRPSYRAREVSLRRQLSTVREMLASLDSLTFAGQQQIMIKVVAFIRGRATEALERVGLNNQRMAGDLLERLVVESKRLVPDTASFALRAESLVTLLEHADDLICFPVLARPIKNEEG